MAIQKKVSGSSISANMIWHFAEKWGCQIVSFVVTTIIARILEPETYGIVAIVNATIQLFTAFVDGGLGYSLIQKKDADDLDFSTALFTNITLCSFIYIIIYLISPFVEVYYQIDGLASMIRVAGIIVLVSAVRNIQQAYVSKRMIFRKFFFASLAGTIGSGIVGIWMAIKNYGVWALIASELFDVIVDTLFIWIFIDWKPKLCFSLDRLKQLTKFGSKVLFVTLSDRIYNKMYHFVIGKCYTSESLAYYDKGNSLTSKVSDNIDSVINSVFFPALANKQDKKVEAKEMARKTLKMKMYIMTPLLIGIISICELIIKVILTDKWLLAVPYIDLFCIINLLLPFQSINIRIVMATGHGNVLMNQEIMNKILGIIILIVTIKLGPLYILVGKVVLNILNVFITSYPNKEILNYGIIEQMKDSIPTIIIGTIMGITVYCVSKLTFINIYIQLLLCIFLGGFIYLVLSIITKNESFIYLYHKILSLRRSK